MTFKRFYRRLNRYVPPVSMIFYIAAAASAIIHVCSKFNAAFAEGFNGTVGAFMRRLLALPFNFMPTSAAEALLCLSPFIVAALIARSVRVSNLSRRRSWRYIAGLFSAAALVYSMFVFTFATGYNTRELDERIGLERAEVSLDELTYTAEKLTEGINATLGDVGFIYSSSSVMPYSITEMNDKLLDAFDRVHESYPFIQNFDSTVKQIVLSEPMTYTHISGVYSFFTGEANLNVNYPDYILPFTAAHELAHQRGIARENEANFVAFLVCMEADDPYIRYSGYMNMYDYVISALYGASPERYSDSLGALDIKARYEMQAFSDFFDKYRGAVIANVSEALNNTYLYLQGTEGTRSYGMVVDLAVAYYISRK